MGTRSLATFFPIASERDAAPCVTSFVDPGDGFVEKCRRAGFELGAESGYLRDRGWVQIATTSCPSSSRRRSDGTADSGVPMKTSRILMANFTVKGTEQEERGRAPFLT